MGLKLHFVNILALAIVLTPQASVGKPSLFPEATSLKDTAQEDHHTPSSNLGTSQVNGSDVGIVATKECGNSCSFLLDDCCPEYFCAALIFICVPDALG